MPFQVIEFVGVHSATRGTSCRWASESWMGCLHRGFPGHCLNSPRWLPDRGSKHCPGDGPWTWSSCFMLLHMQNMKGYGTNYQPIQTPHVAWCAMMCPAYPCIWSNQNPTSMVFGCFWKLSCQVVISSCRLFNCVFLHRENACCFCRRKAWPLPIPSMQDSCCVEGPRGTNAINGVAGELTYAKKERLGSHCLGEHSHRD